MAAATYVCMYKMTFFWRNSNPRLNLSIFSFPNDLTFEVLTYCVNKVVVIIKTAGFDSKIIGSKGEKVGRV